MTRFRTSIAWLMVVVTVIAVDCAWLRAPGGRDDVSLIRAAALILMSDFLAIGFFRILTRRYESHRFLVRFEISGLAVLILFALAPYLMFCEPVVLAIDRFIGAVSQVLVILFWHPLADIDSGDPFGRFLVYSIVILVPALLLTTLLSTLALAGAFLWSRKGRGLV